SIRITAAAVRAVFRCVASRNRERTEVPLGTRIGPFGRENPAPGIRHHTNGQLYYVGFGGYGWSSTSTEHNAYNLDFYPNRLTPGYNSRSGYGFQTRCLQE
ncbi:MAG: hypothetical protein K2G93_07985, partial [Rikenella sp.]|nr:hypothetical protein [Rikenella sp.]